MVSSLKECMYLTPSEMMESHYLILGWLWPFMLRWWWLFLTAEGTEPSKAKSRVHTNPIHPIQGFAEISLQDCESNIWWHRAGSDPSCTWHLSSPVYFSFSSKMQILLKNASDWLFSLALFYFQIKEQPQHPPSSSLLFPSWQKIKAYVFPRCWYLCPEHAMILFLTLFSLPCFSLWKSLGSLTFFSPSAPTSALPFPSLPHCSW